MWVNMDENELLMHKHGFARAQGYHIIWSMDNPTHFILRMTIPGKMLGSEFEALIG